MTDLRDTIHAFRNCVADPVGYAAAWKQSTSRPVVGFTCSYFPEELALAAGALPVRLTGTASGVVMAAAHLQAYACSLARTVLEDALSGTLDFLDVMVFPHTCDTMQRLSDIWRLNIHSHLHMDLEVPARLDGEAVRQYLESVLARFRENLADALETPRRDEALVKAVGLTNRIRAGLERLYGHRSRVPHGMSGSDLNTVVRGAMIMDRSEAADRIESLVQRLESDHSGPGPGAPPIRILLSGGVCLHPDIHGIVESQNAAIVWDDLCTGTRWFNGLIDTAIPPIQGIADHYLNRIICPAKHGGTGRRATDLMHMVISHGIQGVIFLVLKFCDPHGFDFPDLKAELDRVGIPTLLLEMETGTVVDGQVHTRIESFLQMLHQRVTS